MLLPQLAHTGPTHREWNPSFACEQNNFWWCRSYFFDVGFWDGEGMSVNLCLRSLSIQSASMIAHLISLKVWKISGILGHVRHLEENISALYAHYCTAGPHLLQSYTSCNHRFQNPGMKSNTICCTLAFQSSMWVQSAHKFMAFLWEVFLKRLSFGWCPHCHDMPPVFVCSVVFFFSFK